MVEAALDAVLSQLSRRILEKLEKGKKLTVEDILLLYIDLQYRELKELREELRETNRRIDVIRLELLKKIDETNKRIDETNRRIDSIHLELSKKIDETNKRIDRIHLELSRKIDNVYLELSKKMDELNRRIDRLYELQTAKKE